MSQQRNNTRNSDKEQKDPSQFEQFEDLAKRLLAVPKQEADKQRAKKNGKKDR